ncbi:MAG: insulinase family protein, partial [Muribaculaceae bacterium]|nr:insulinase family protein [Muribaculaceae bacterium]
VLGTIIPGIYEINHAASALFTNIIGGPGMNSLLNLGLRERRGLVYTVEASTTLYRDTGMWSIYFGCDRQDTEKCIAEINRIISSATEKDLSDKKLAQYKRQITGQMTVARDNREAAIMSMARATLYHGHALTLEESAEKIMAVTIDDLRSLSSHLLNLSELTFC